ncbi:MAG TPA: hypothetical protein VF179_22150, partial [Thermoanaerobaculia bacterium]|nr:hypothetical protein [Thermoanaerobaculia bacterium]
MSYQDPYVGAGLAPAREGVNPSPTSCLLACFLVALTMAAPVSAQAPAKQTPPPPKPAKEIRFPAFEEKTLANG